MGLNSMLVGPRKNGETIWKQSNHSLALKSSTRTQNVDINES